MTMAIAVDHQRSQQIVVGMAAVTKLGGCMATWAACVLVGFLRNHNFLPKPPGAIQKK